MIKYKSTRGDKNLYTFSEVILKGIAYDSGLFIPEKIPTFSLKELFNLQNKSYADVANFILNLFLFDFSKSEIFKITKRAYEKNFDNPKITPLVRLKNNQYILELWHGPTSAFKDMALQLMPLFFAKAVKIDNTKRIKNKQNPLQYTILVATSGDTGIAALKGYKDLENVSITIFYPKGRVSKLQELQMITQEGGNISVYGIHGDFDTTQSLVKDIFNDKMFNQKLLEENTNVLSSANSINWGRLPPQIIYHVQAYVDLVEKHIIKIGDTIDIAVPCGNFGNILAAYYAKKMGLPINKLICASNENNALTQFLTTGVYDITKRKLKQTPSPAIDILIASNIERLLYEITQDSKKVSLWMNDLKEKGAFEVDNTTKTILLEEFFADWVSNDACLENIKNIYEETDYLMDPHTSVAQVVADRYIKQNTILNPVIICSTAHWAKFAKDIYKAIYPYKKASVDEFSIIDEICSLGSNIRAPKSIKGLKQKKKVFNKTLVNNVNLVKKTIIEEINSEN